MTKTTIDKLSLEAYNTWAIRQTQTESDRPLLFPSLPPTLPAGTSTITSAFATLFDEGAQNPWAQFPPPPPLSLRAFRQGKIVPSHRPFSCEKFPQNTDAALLKGLTETLGKLDRDLRDIENLKKRYVKG